MVMDLLWRGAGMFLFMLEAYHVLAHLNVLCRVRLLPRKDLVRVRMYFLVDGMSSFVVAFLYTGRHRWLISLHVLQHLYYYFCWEKTRWAKRIVNWSSLDWFQSPKAGGVEMDNILGTMFDVVVHMVNLWVLGSAFSSLHIVLLLLLANGGMLLIMFNPRLAWASPSSMPAWVQKRIKPLPAEKDL